MPSHKGTVSSASLLIPDSHLYPYHSRNLSFRECVCGNAQTRVRIRLWGQGRPQVHTARILPHMCITAANLYCKVIPCSLPILLQRVGNAMVGGCSGSLLPRIFRAALCLPEQIGPDILHGRYVCTAGRGAPALVINNWRGMDRAAHP